MNWIPKFQQFRDHGFFYLQREDKYTGKKVQTAIMAYPLSYFELGFAFAIVNNPNVKFEIAQFEIRTNPIQIQFKILSCALQWKILLYRHGNTAPRGLMK
jgi:hypothetical protein